MKTGLQHNGTMLVRFAPRTGDGLQGTFTLLNGNTNSSVEFADVLELLTLIDRSVTDQRQSLWSERCDETPE